MRAWPPPSPLLDDGKALREWKTLMAAHHKYVYCRSCDRVVCMRIGAIGCHCGRIGIVRVVPNDGNETRDETRSCLS